MVGFYEEMQAVASELLSEFKQGVIEYVAVTPGTGPANNPGPSTKVPTTVNAVARGVKFKYIDGSQIVSSDLQITMPGDTVKPAMNGFIRVDGVDHKIIKIEPKPAAGIPVAFVVIFRK